MYLYKVTLALLMSALALAAVNPGDPLVLDFRNSDGTRERIEQEGLVLEPNQHVEIYVVENPSTGYQWSVENVENNDVFQTHEEYFPNANNEELTMLGAPGHSVFYI